MSTKIPNVDTYFTAGCGRCRFFNTPQCKVHSWHDILKKLRSILLASGLNEELKWSMPCYTLNGVNIVLMSAFKEYCALSFFKGALLRDPHGVLTTPGENTQAGRQMRFTSLREVKAAESIIKEYVREAVDIEKAGLKVAFKKNPEPVPEELEKKMDAMPALKKAFHALTPGRQRAYILFFSAAKQSKTREARIEKYERHILDGKGMNDV